jgi:hypothetical protein
MTISEAFFDVCSDAKEANGCYVSLYLNTPFYGGPEEGGWWGKDTELIAYQWYATEEQACQAKKSVTKKADELNESARREHGEYCGRTMEWLEARGLDADFLPEVDGECVYYVVTEDTPGEFSSRGERHYS